MFCGNCGTENINGAKFCKNCGKVLNASGDAQVEKKMLPPQRKVEQVTSMPITNTPGENEKQSAGKAKALPIKMLIGAAAAIVALIVIICIVLNSGTTIDMNDYLTIEMSGYDGYGTARASIDWDAINAKYGQKLEFTSQAKNEYGGLITVMTPLEVLEQSIKVELENTSGLSNGDKIAYTWSVDEELFTYVKCKVKHKDTTFDVSGLQAVGTFDAFANLEVMFYGVAPYGSAELNYTGSELSYNDFDCDKIDGLSNGDTIKVTIDSSKLNNYAEILGMVPETFEKEYEVTGLSSYLSQNSEVSEEALSSMQRQASDVFQAYVAQSWDDTAKLDSFTYIGNYLLTKKQSDSYGGSANILYLVYKAQARNKYSNEGQTYDRLNDVYWYISFEDLMLESDGTLTVDVMSYGTPDDSFTVDSGISSGWWSTMSWYYYGYPTLDELYKNVVTKNMDAYNHEDNVDESAAPTTEVENKPVKETNEANESDYILPTSDSVYLTKADLEGLTAEECKIARNEIYARHGRKFNDKDLQAHFDACDWYVGTIEPDAFQESILSDIEIANRNLIVEYEEEKGYK